MLIIYAIRNLRTDYFFRVSSRPPPLESSYHSATLTSLVITDASHNGPAFPLADLGLLIVRLCTQHLDAQPHSTAQQRKLPPNAKTDHRISSKEARAKGKPNAGLMPAVRSSS
ncbi:hypothetical protein GX50_01765 [[Emmonsia] crescens]|uniref:Uncharacterized protein n=1 Tax=[Emmonsia] crescens TaxID=73230 RepID=A0A2B7ZRP2_9EURO|nr:hypothetical protein GX50_01765 [Emmonsia crescens]